VSRRTITLIALVVCALGYGYPHAAGAAEREGISSGQAAAIARGAYNGQVVSVQSVGKSGDGGWKVRVLLDGGRVKTVHVDSRGAIRGSN
jgi:hypothetical protein